MRAALVLQMGIGELLAKRQKADGYLFADKLEIQVRMRLVGPPGESGAGPPRPRPQSFLKWLTCTSR